MSYKEYFAKTYYNSMGEKFARVRTKLQTYKGVVLGSTTQLEGFVLGKWLPLIRYDYNPKDEMPVHINREFISTDDRLNKIQYKCRPKLLASTAQKIFFSLSEIQIMEFIEKRKLVFLRECK